MPDGIFTKIDIDLNGIMSKQIYCLIISKSVVVIIK